MLDPTGDNVEKVLDSAFQELGLPKAMRSDNGPPFASTGAGRLSRLSVWRLKLDIALERIEPGIGLRTRKDRGRQRPRSSRIRAHPPRARS